MLQLLRMIVRRAPLLAMILLIWVLSAVLAFAGRNRGYKNYSTRSGLLPGISVVMRGIHDQVLPWSDTGAEDAGDQDAEEKTEEEEEPVSSDSETENEEAPSSEAVETGHKQDVESASREDTGAEEDRQDKEDGPDAETKDTDSKDGDTASTDKKTDNNSDASTEKEEKTEPSAPEDLPLQVPETSCSKVVDAKDYGVADSQYLSPDDTVYNTDKEGLFAPNGIYYSLQQVEDSYFTDALFIGDSRTVGLFEYGGMESKTSFLARESTTVYDLLDEKEMMDYTPKGKKTSEISMKKLLKESKFRKIYLSVGVNELGIPDTVDYYKEFRKVVEAISKMQPEAVIYIQGIMHVSRDKSEKDSVYNNTAIVQRNRAISTLANGRSIFYIDMNQELCDEDGNLKKDLTGDGIHLKASACELWVNFLKNNAIVVPD